MALGTVHADSQKRLANSLRGILRSALAAVEICWADVTRIASCHDDVIHPLVIRPVFMDLLTNPFVERICATSTNRRRIHHHDVGPPLSPVIGEVF